MKLVQINVTLKSGSTGRIAYQLHECLDANGVENTIAFGYGDLSDPVGFSLYDKLGTHLHSFLSRKLCMQGLSSVWQTGRLIRYLKKQQPDIIHLHNIHGHYLHYGMLFRYLKKLDKPVVWTLHDCWAFTGKCAHYFLVGCEKWKKECHHCPNLAAYPDSTWDGSQRNYRLKKKWFAGLDKLTVVCNSDWLKSQVEQSFLKEKKICRIYNGVDTNVFRPANCSRVRLREKYGVPADKFLVLGVSSVWKETKGLGTFYRLAEQLDQESIIVLVGVTQAQKERLPHNIIGITKTENIQELAELYSLADVLVNPSREETFGMVAVEAMACGTPVIVSNTTACPEIVKLSTGYAIDMSSVDEIVEALGCIRAADKMRYWNSCVESVKENFSVSKMTANYLELYKRLYNEVEI